MICQFKKQPSFLNWKENDKQVGSLLLKAIKQTNSIQISDKTQLVSRISTLKQAVKFESDFTFTRQIQRELPDGSRIQFIWNKSDAWQTVSFLLDKKYKSSYWLNAEDGSTNNNSSASKIAYQIPPYSSIILYASTKNSREKAIAKTPILNPTNAKTVLNIEHWAIQTDSLILTNSPLFDWKTNEEFKYVGTEGVYKSVFEMNNLDKKTTYLLDLGKVYHTAEVFINGKFVGKRIFAPYVLDISSFILKGSNDIEIRVTPTALNYFIGQGVSGNKQYGQFKKSGDQLMSNGLVGAVKILEIKN